jgi:hypothetical protein
VAEHVGGEGATHAKPAGHPLSNEQRSPEGALVLTHACSKLPQWTPEQNWLVPGPMQVQVPAHGWPHPIAPPAHVGTVVLVVLVVTVVLDVGAEAGAQSIFVTPGVTVLAPN